MITGGFHLKSAIKLSKQWGPPLSEEMIYEVILKEEHKITGKIVLRKSLRTVNIEFFN